ncbi:MAG: hypothetical protein N3E46_03035 [Gemmataceae bacterium]|nr:hypothetical protein [Gemmataceae bacterium]
MRRCPVTSATPVPEHYTITPQSKAEWLHEAELIVEMVQDRAAPG